MMKMFAQPDGFRTTDRRGQNHDTREPDGVEIVERDADGAECVYIMRHGKKVMVKQGGHDIEQLQHRFETCSVCHEQHMIVGDEKIQCPRVGWQWTMGHGPGYGYRGHDDATRQLDPGGTTPRTNNLAQLARVIGYTD